MNVQSPFAISGVVIVFFSLPFLCSCSSKQSISSKKTLFNPSLTGYSSKPDPIVPIGFQCTQKRAYAQQDGPLLITRHEGIQPREQVVSFYRREMEAAGWDLSDFSDDQEGLFFCYKGHQECAIVIRTKGKTIIKMSHRTRQPSNTYIEPDTTAINKPLTQKRL